jgi:TPR repeat protein
MQDFQNKDMEKLVIEDNKLAERGDAAVNVEMGLRYLSGDRVEKNPKIAADFFKMAADKKDAQGQYELGKCYQFGAGVQKNEKNGVHYYQLAAGQGYAAAQYKLALLYNMGSYGLPKNSKKSIELFRLAADKEHADSQYFLALFYETGDSKDIEKNEREAIKYFHLAAHNGSSMAQERLALRYARGEGVIEDAKETVRLLKAAAQQGDPDALTHLAMCYEEGYGVKKDMKHAENLYCLAVERQHKQAQILLQELRSLQKQESKSEIKITTSPTSIVLIFHYPQESGIDYLHRPSLKYYRKKHPAAEIIFVDKNDFSIDGRLRACRKHKYESLLRASAYTKIKIGAHGSNNHSDIASDEVYLDSSSTTAFFTAKMVAHLIRKIQDSSVIRKRTSSMEDEQFPPKHLKILIHACQGINFGKALFNELYNDIKNPIVLCSITAPKHNMGIIGAIGGKKFYVHDSKTGYVEFLLSRHSKSGIIFLFFLAIYLIGISTANPSISKTSIGFLCASFLTACYEFISLCRPNLDIEKGLHNNSQHKVVITPDFARFSNHRIPCKLQTKDEYRGKVFPADSTTIEIQPGVLLDKPLFF